MRGRVLRSGDGEMLLGRVDVRTEFVTGDTERGFNPEDILRRKLLAIGKPRLDRGLTFSDQSAERNLGPSSTDCLGEW